LGGNTAKQMKEDYGKEHLVRKKGKSYVKWGKKGA